MKKSVITKGKIYDYIKNNPGKSTSQISKYLGLTPVSILLHLQDLIKLDLVYKTGSTRSTRYFIQDKKSDVFVEKNFFKNLSRELSEEYDGLDNVDLEELLDNLVGILYPIQIGFPQKCTNFGLTKF